MCVCGERTHKHHKGKHSSVFIRELFIVSKLSDQETYKMYIYLRVDSIHKDYRFFDRVFTQLISLGFPPAFGILYAFRR